MIIAEKFTIPRPRPRTVAGMLLAALASMPALAAKTDVVVLRNGDHVTGEVQQMSYGTLEFKTDDMGTVFIEWDKIASLTTRQRLQVELVDGGRLFGRAPVAADEAGSLQIVDAQDSPPSAVPMATVARLYTVESGKWYRRLEGDVSIGYSFTQSSDVEVLNFGANLGARNEKRRWNIELDGQRTTQSAAPDSERASLVGAVERFLPDRYYYETTFGLVTNRELGLDLRTVATGTAGRYLHRSGDSEWRAGLGLALQSEDRTDGSRQESLEAVLTTTLRIFRLDSPKTDLDFTLTALPSLTESGRWRGEGNLDLRKEIIKDLFFEISLWGAYDNQPAEGAETSDWSVVTSLGYSF